MPGEKPGGMNPARTFLIISVSSNLPVGDDLSKFSFGGHFL
jgi:hypothetical protein